MARERHDLSQVPGPVLLACKRAIVDRWTEGRTLDEAITAASDAAYSRDKALRCGEVRARLACRLIEDVGAEMRRELDELAPPSV